MKGGGDRVSLAPPRRRKGDGPVGVGVERRYAARKRGKGAKCAQGRWLINIVRDGSCASGGRLRGSGFQDR